MHCTQGCEARIWSLLIKKIYTKETLCIWNLNRPLSFGSDSFQKKVLKEVKTPIHREQSPCTPLFPLPWLLLLPPWLAWMCSPVVFGKAEVCLESALLPEGELAVHVCSITDPGLRFDGERFSLFSAGLPCKWINEKFCFLRGTMTSPQPSQATK